MAVCRTLPAALFALLAAMPLAAQHPPAGTISFRMHVTVPDSMRAKYPVGNAVDVQFTVASDGHQYALDVVTGPIPPMQAMSAHLVFTPAKDTLHIGLVLPPDLAAMAGGAPGFRLDVPTSIMDSIAHAASSMMNSFGPKLADSIRKMLPQLSYRSLGTSAMVGGLSCEEWQTTNGSDTTEMCVIPTPPVLSDMQEHVGKMLGGQAFLQQLSGFADLAKQAFGGRKMTVIRMAMPKRGVRMELVSYSASMPDASVFVLPPNLQSIPMPTIPIKPHGGGSGQQ